MRMVVVVQRGSAGLGGVVVRIVPVFVPGGRGRRRRCRRIRAGHVGGGQIVGRGVAGWRFVGGRRALGRAFALFAQELAVAQPQQALVHADGVGALEVGSRLQARLFLQQRLRVDDDLALAAEVGRQGLLDAGLQAGGHGLLRRWPAQDHAGAAAFLRAGLAGVVHDELGDQVVAGGHAQRLRLQHGGKAALPGRAAAVEGAALGLEGDVLAAALGQGQAQARRRPRPRSRRWPRSAASSRDCPSGTASTAPGSVRASARAPAAGGPAARRGGAAGGRPARRR